MNDAGGERLRRRSEERRPTGWHSSAQAIDRRERAPNEGFRRSDGGYRGGPPSISTAGDGSHRRDDRDDRDDHARLAADHRPRRSESRDFGRASERDRRTREDTRAQNPPRAHVPRPHYTVDRGPNAGAGMGSHEWHRNGPWRDGRGSSGDRGDGLYPSGRPNRDSRDRPRADVPTDARGRRSEELARTRTRGDSRSRLGGRDRYREDSREAHRRSTIVEGSTDKWDRNHRRDDDRRGRDGGIRGAWRSGGIDSHRRRDSSRDGRPVFDGDGGIGGERRDDSRGRRGTEGARAASFGRGHTIHGDRRHDGWGNGHKRQRGAPWQCRDDSRGRRDHVLQRNGSRDGRGRPLGAGRNLGESSTSPRSESDGFVGFVDGQWFGGGGGGGGGTENQSGDDYARQANNAARSLHASARADTRERGPAIPVAAAAGTAVPEGDVARRPRWDKAGPGAVEKAVAAVSAKATEAPAKKKLVWGGGGNSSQNSSAGGKRPLWGAKAPGSAGGTDENRSGEASGQGPEAGGVEEKWKEAAASLGPADRQVKFLRLLGAKKVAADTAAAADAGQSAQSPAREKASLTGTPGAGGSESTAANAKIMQDLEVHYQKAHRAHFGFHRGLGT